MLKQQQQQQQQHLSMRLLCAWRSHPELLSVDAAVYTSTLDIAFAPSSRKSAHDGNKACTEKEQEREKTVKGA